MLRGNPTLILDSCSVRAKRGGDLTGPRMPCASRPTDRGKKGTKYHVAVNGDGIPVACMATAANVDDAVLFERLFVERRRSPDLAGFAVVARIRTVFADCGYDAESSRALYRSFGVEPHIHKRRQLSRSSLGKQRWPMERSNAWLLENKHLALRYDRLGFIVQALLQTSCILLVAGGADCTHQAVHQPMLHLPGQRGLPSAANCSTRPRIMMRPPRGRTVRHRWQPRAAPIKPHALAPIHNQGVGAVFTHQDVLLCPAMQPTQPFSQSSTAGRAPPWHAA